jgi:3-phosphoshikimate 1-carboxyvinyltransferase
MNSITIQPILQAFNKSLSIPGSKSITNRALLLAALAQGESQLYGVLSSADTLAFRDALIALGVPIDWDEQQHQCSVIGGHHTFPKKSARIFCQDAGTAARFLTAACAQVEGEYIIDASPQMRKRPMHALLEVLQQQGAQFDQRQYLPVQVRGQHPLVGGEIFIAGEVSSQFMSALLMIAPLAKHDVTLKTKKLISRPYVEMTRQLMAKFGISSTWHDAQTINIAAPQSYQATELNIEPDLSTAAYFFAAAAITQSTIHIPQIERRGCLQGDVQFLQVLEQMGCVIKHTGDGLTLHGPAELNGIAVNMADFSDTFMTLACIAPFATSPVIISGIAHTQWQESNRMQAVYNNLRALGIQVEMRAEGLKIYPGQPHAGCVDSYQDHRIAMAFALLGLRQENIQIQNADCVNKTCPDYFSILASLSR